MLASFLNFLVIGLVVVAAVALYRAFVGPTAIDRVLSINLVTSEVVALILIYSYLHSSTHYIDVALVLVLGSFIGTICVLKLLSEGKLI
ncbi:MAG: monovalent cation/H+ antiporter complex subunit F [Dethiobacteria bacterium]|jgi:multicomponent Na+:H+ antiporter subunit F|nr:monovalent cation/H+ antiporter complex subunit F [Bacillota bacterium]HOB28578.1 monovalent cation/H+ antiporter complex subunit F [Bacillota bacterium]HQD52045.1 monovalent cation/H+ antiporter complex subunit F [Bacillota bacterium]